MNSDKNSKLVINITAGSFFKAVLIILGLWFLFFIKDLVLVVLTAVVIASSIEPLITWFKKFKIARLPSVIITYITLLAVFVGLFYFFVPSVLNEASSFLSSVPKYLETTPLWNPLNVSTEDVTKTQKIAQTLSVGINDPEQLATNLASQGLSTIKATGLGLRDIISGIQSVTSNVSDGFIKIVSAVFGGLLSFVLIVVISFYLAVQEDGVAKFLGLITPVKHEKYVVDLWKRSQRKIGQWMQGQLLLMILIGVLTYLGLMILGVKNAILLAVLAGLLEIIPLFGPVMAAIPAILVAFVDNGITASLLVTGLYIIVQQFENHLIYPLVVKKIVGVSPIFVILSIIIGAKLAGFLGVVLSVPIISAIMEFVDDIDRRKTLFWQKAQETKES
jgi:predicted PurR-regulated permease PerM